MKISFEDGIVNVNFENDAFHESYTDLEVLLQAAYDKGRYENPNMFETFKNKYFELQQADTDLKKTQLDMNLMQIAEIDSLQKELKLVKDKYIKLLEVYKAREQQNGQQ